jgi:hypothetical protein
MSNGEVDPEMGTCSWCKEYRNQSCPEPMSTSWRFIPHLGPKRSRHRRRAARPWRQYHTTAGLTATQTLLLLNRIPPPAPAPTRGRDASSGGPKGCRHRGPPQCLRVCVWGQQRGAGIWGSGRDPTWVGNKDSSSKSNRKSETRSSRVEISRGGRASNDGEAVAKCQGKLSSFVAALIDFR